MKTFRLLVMALAACVGPIAMSSGQVPTYCACNVTINTPSGSDQDMGSVTTYATCSVTYPTPTTPQCEVSGTIQLDFEKIPAGYTITTSRWGLPDQSFTVQEDESKTFTHPSGVSVACNGSLISSYLQIIATGGGSPRYLQCVKEWSCSPD